MRLVSSSLSMIPVALLLAACAAETDAGKGDIGDDESGFRSSHVSAACAASRDAILAGAGSAARRNAIERGFTWLDAKVPYSQAKSYNGYRTDCSGFVSMCWDLGTSLTTATFNSDNASSKKLPSFDSLAPGDALVRRSGSSGHVVLFLGWNDDAKNGACVLEQANTASDMQFGVRSTSSLKSSGYKAIRATKLGAGGGPEADVGGDGEAEDVNDVPLPPPRPTTPAPTPTTPLPPPRPPLPAPQDPGGAADPDAECFFACVDTHAATSRFVECASRCGADEVCEDDCFDLACGQAPATCDNKLAECEQRCGL